MRTDEEALLSEMSIDSEELEDTLSRHPGEEMLIDFFLGRLDDAVHLTVQCHLIDCDSCLGAVKEVTDFLDTDDGNIPGMQKGQAEQVWRNVLEALKADAKSPAITAAPRPKSEFNRRAAAAVSAIIVVSLAAAGLGIVNLKRNNDRLAEEAGMLARELAEAREEREKRKADLEEQPLPQERASEADRGSKPQDAQPSQLNVNVPIYNIYPKESASRSGEAGEANRIKLPSKPGPVIFVLVGDEKQGSEYEIEILNEKGRLLRRAGGLVQNSYGNIVISINGEWLRPGSYRLRLHDSGRQRAKGTTEYLLIIE